MLLQLFWTYLKVGTFTLGGGYAMLPLIQREVVDYRKWIDETEFLNMIALAQAAPGLIAVNSAIFIGHQVGAKHVPPTKGRVWSRMYPYMAVGAAVLGAVLPSFVIILIVAKCYAKFKSSRLVVGAMNGLKPAVVGLIAAALLSLSQTVFFPAGLSVSVLGTAQFYVSLGIFAAAVVLAFKKLHPILIILLSAVIGVVAGYLLPI